MYVIVLATAQPIERTPNKLETKLKENTDDVGTSVFYIMCHICRRYLHHRHFVFISVSNLFRVRSLGFAVAITRTCIIYRVILKIKKKIRISMIWRIKSFNLFHLLPCWDVGTQWYTTLYHSVGVDVLFYLYTFVQLRGLFYLYRKYWVSFQFDLIVVICDPFAAMP